MNKPTDKALRAFLRDVFERQYSIHELITEIIDMTMYGEYNEVLKEYIEHKENG